MLSLNLFKEIIATKHDPANIIWELVAAYIREAENRIIDAEFALQEEKNKHQWQPIETAPKDGTEIIGYAPISLADGNPAMGVIKGVTDDVGFYWEVGIHAKRGPLASVEKYTHWRPLPEGPKE